MTDTTLYDDDFFSNEDYFKPFKKAINVKSLEKLKKEQQFLKDHIQFIKF
tara:strand:- start:37 stop:186 length:150 start_codon:yes stop_codon:yes gene_type:complete